MRQHDEAHSIESARPVDHRRLERVGGYALKTGVEHHERERCHAPGTVEHQCKQRQRWGGGRREIRVVEHPLQRCRENAVGVEHPVEHQRADQRRDDQRQQGEEDHRTLPELRNRVHRERDREAEQHPGWGHDEGAGAREGEHLVEREVVEPVGDVGRSVVVGEDRPDLVRGEVVSVETGREPREAPERLGLLERRGRRCVHPGLLGAVEWSASLDGGKDLFVFHEQ